MLSTKELVDWLLEINTHNRTIKQSQVDSLCSDITNDRFYFTNQGIGITRSGFLTDGQHRLLALKKSGYPPVDLLIVTGLDDEAQAVVDRHSKRSQADIIRLVLNKTVSNQAVAAINIIMRVKSNGERFMMSSGRISEFEIAEFMSEYGDVLSLVFSSLGSSIRASVAAAIIEYALRFDVESACSLAEQIKTGIALNANDPAYRLRLWMERNKGGGSAQQLESYSITVSACIAHSKGEKLMLLRESGSWARLTKKKKILWAINEGAQ